MRVRATTATTNRPGATARPAARAPCRRSASPPRPRTPRPPPSPPAPRAPRRPRPRRAESTPPAPAPPGVTFSGRWAQ
ncbi:hypothetical protein EAO72_30670 [Streptomyces sp. or43]|nr:hypothetical protein EAO72_30670 [Streptomyces sp. or43]